MLAFNIVKIMQIIFLCQPGWSHVRRIRCAEGRFGSLFIEVGKILKGLELLIGDVLHFQGTKCCNS